MNEMFSIVQRKFLADIQTCVAFGKASKFKFHVHLPRSLRLTGGGREEPHSPVPLPGLLPWTQWRNFVPRSRLRSANYTLEQIQRKRYAACQGCRCRDSLEWAPLRNECLEAETVPPVHTDAHAIVIHSVFYFHTVGQQLRRFIFTITMSNCFTLKSWLAFSRSALQFSRIFPDFSIPMITIKAFQGLENFKIKFQDFPYFSCICTSRF